MEKLNIPKTILTMEQMGFPFNMGEFFTETEKNLQRRVIIIDDSYSMEENDGNLFIEGNSRQCSRQEEMITIVRESHYIFKKLNSKTKYVSVSGDYIETMSERDIHEIFPDMRFFQDITNILEKISTEFENIEGEKRIVIITDYQPCSKEFVNVLRKLIISINVTIRICGSNSFTNSMWSDINVRLGNKLNIINSYEEEIIKISRINRNLNYTYELHKLREYGICNDLINQVSKRKLTKEEKRFLNRLTIQNISCFFC